MEEMVVPEALERWTAELESTLRAEVSRLSAAPCPPRLGEALAAALFPGGARLRPRLCLAVAAAVGDAEAGLPAAVAVEMFHCASLVHDDLPCFDGAELRRGQPTIHRAFGEPTAVLVGDALIIAGFEVLARGVSTSNGRRMASSAMAEQVLLFASALGSVRGLVAGQAWENEERVDLAHYHQTKTGALFEAACAAGAIAAGADGAPFRPLGRAIGRAYQILDDVMDATGSEAATGKSGRRDAQLGRPSAVGERSPADALSQAAQLLEEAAVAIPETRGRAALARMVRAEGHALLRRCSRLVDRVA